MADRVVIDARALFEKLAKLQDGMAPQKYLVAMQQSLVAWVARNFQSQGADQTPSWPPMSPNTRAARRKGGGGAKLLQNTGHLRESFAPGKGGSSINVSAMQFTVGTNVEYAKFHEFGTKPYVIQPKGAKGFLSFKTADGWRRAKKINHPGLPMRKMLPRPAVAKATALKTLQAAITRTLQTLKQGGRA